MADHRDGQEDQGEAFDAAGGDSGDGGIPLDTFWALLDPIDARDNEV